MEIYYIDFLNKEKNFIKDRKLFYGKDPYQKALTWGKKNVSNFNSDMIKLMK